MSKDSCANLVLMPCIFVLLLNNHLAVHLFSSSTLSPSSSKAQNGQCSWIQPDSFSEHRYFLQISYIIYFRIQEMLRTGFCYYYGTEQHQIWCPNTEISDLLLLLAQISYTMLIKLRMALSDD